MQTLTGPWCILSNSVLSVNGINRPGKVISIHAGQQLVIVLYKNESFERVRVAYPDYRGTLGGFQELLRDYPKRKLSVTEWAPIRYWEYGPSDTHGHRIRGRDIFSQEIVSSAIQSIRFPSNRKAEVLTYSTRRDVWEVLPLWGSEEEIVDLKTYCQQYNIKENPSVTDDFMRHYTRV